MRRSRRRSLKALTGLSFASFIALFAAQGKAFIDAIAAMPAVLSNFADVLPLGSATFFLVVVVSGIVWFMAQRYFIRPTLKATHGKEFTSELLALITACVAMLLLNLAEPTPAGTTYTATIVKALMLGILAGFTAPWLAKGLLGFSRWVNSFTSDAVEDEEEAPKP